MFAALLALVPAAAQAQASATTPQSSPPAGQTYNFSTLMQRGLQGVQRNLLEAAEKMPEADYGFKPTAEVRPFGHIVAHIALSQFSMCSTLKGEKSPQAGEKEEAPRTKAELIALLKESQTYCEPTVTGTTEENLKELVKSGPNQVPRAAFVQSNIVHANETYGVMTVYLRLKGIVPAIDRSTEQRSSRQQSVVSDQATNHSRSSRLSERTRPASAARIASASSRFVSCSAATFSSTVSLAIKRYAIT
jgi:uncharacterized damage-inducible protein DinB